MKKLDTGGIALSRRPRPAPRQRRGFPGEKASLPGAGGACSPAGPPGGAVAPRPGAAGAVGPAGAGGGEAQTAPLGLAEAILPSEEGVEKRRVSQGKGRGQAARRRKRRLGP